jgi:dihydropteroate synthase
MTPAEERREFVYTFGSRRYNLSARTHIMGILNVTPDSFSDGGKFLDPLHAVDRALAMAADGADFVDVGGESTRPRGRSYGEGAAAVDAEEELRRILPVIRSVASKTDVPISVDTTKASVARKAIDAGAVMVNDITGFHADPAMAHTVADGGASAALMHIRGNPQTMQQEPSYKDLFREISEYLHEGIEIATRAGVRQILVDPGIGFGKTLEHNLTLLGQLDRLASLGYPILVGPSRKSFLGTILGLPVEERLEGTLASVVAAILHGAHVVRVHDVKEAKRAALVADAIKKASISG